MSRLNAIDRRSRKCLHSPGRLPFVIVAAMLISAGVYAQTPDPPPSAAAHDSQHLAEIEHRLNDLASTLTMTRNALQQSLLEIERLRSELNALRAQSDTPSTISKAAPPLAAQTPSDSSSSLETDLQALHEQQDILQAEIKQHDQTKVETDSKYRLKITGIALFNAFSNVGVVNNAELPTLALPRVPGGSHGSNGASLRQTVFGIAAAGPLIAGARSSANINIDFFGGSTTNAYGYSAAGGYVRMRDAALLLAWDKSTVELGYSVPLISPLSPTSYATVAEPSLASSGNLWTWSPQVRFEQRVPLADRKAISLEAGLLYPSSPNYNSIQADSPIEASRHPGVEGRIAYRSNSTATPSPHVFALGVGAYTASQFYSSNTRIHSWAVTADWQMPLSKHFDLSGELYRGRALGGLGGGLYKDVITGIAYDTGLSRTNGVETAGGWSQLKLTVSSRLEANAIFGLDDAFASSFDNLLLPASTSPLTLAARNQSVVANVIFRPRASLVLSPEYRHIISWSYQGASNTANIFTLSAGYQF